MTTSKNLLSKGFLVALLAASSMLAPACSEQQQEDVIEPTGNEKFIPIPLSRAEQEIVDTQNDFALEMFRNIHGTTDINSNFFISPLSVSMSMSALANGANGDTRSQIIKTLGFKDSDIEPVNALNKRLINDLQTADAETDVIIANATWLHKDFKAKNDFVSACKDSYGMEFSSVDLYSNKAVKEINSWAKKNTRGMLEDFISAPFNAPTRMMLANVTYFGGNWISKFCPEDTRRHSFRNADGSISQVQMMRHNYPHGNRHRVDGAWFVNLLYGNGAYAMGLILPDEDKTVNDITGNLDGETISRWIEDAYSAEPSLFIVHLPRFEIYSSELDLTETLSDMGITNAFNAATADFSNLSDEKINVTDICHNSFIKVDEEGTKAWTVTKYLNGSSVGNREMIFDCPFAFFIYERSTKAILFMGAVNKL